MRNRDVIDQIYMVLLGLLLGAILLLGAVELLQFLAPHAARAAEDACPLEAGGLLWTAADDTYTMFIDNPTSVPITVNHIDIGIYTGLDTGEVPDPHNMIWKRVAVPTTIAKPRRLTPLDFKAPGIDPTTTDGHLRVECSVV